jgi:alkylhydroperoxidase family enzyme
MFVLHYHKPEETSVQEVAEVYEVFAQKRSPVPAPLQLMSTSPGLLKQVFAQISYFMHHDRLSFPLLAAIRFLAAQQVCFEHCTTLNRIWLGKTGLSEQDLDDLAAGREVAAFTAAENSLLQTVAKVLRREKIGEEEVGQLRKLGWRDSDILDACAQGTNMLGLSCLFEAFSRQDNPS